MLISGYMAPEYAMEGTFSVKSDVFSFGVLLLEVVSGRKNSGFHLARHGHSLLTYVSSSTSVFNQKKPSNLVMITLVSCINCPFLSICRI